MPSFSDSARYFLSMSLQASSFSSDHWGKYGLRSAHTGYNSVDMY